MRLVLTTLFLCCSFAGVSCTLYAAQRPVVQDVPFSVPSSLLQAGAHSFDMATTKEIVLTKDELNAAIANHTIVELINRLIESHSVIKFPAGTYQIPAVIFVSNVTDVVLQGEVDSRGRPLTTLNFTRSLTQLYGNNIKTYGSFGAWHGGGGLITVGSKHPLYNNGTSKSAENVGIENFNITFNRTVYHGSCEDGYNGIFFNKTRNCYVRNVNVTNYDSAIILSGVTYTTLKDVVLNAVRNGHFGAVIVGGSYNLIDNLKTLSATSHPIAIQKTNHNVIKNCTLAKGKGDGISYRGGCNTNLFWNIHSAQTILGSSNGQKSTLAITYGPNEYYWNCVYKGAKFSAASVPSFLRGNVHAYYGSQLSPFIITSQN